MFKIIKKLKAIFKTFLNIKSIKSKDSNFKMGAPGRNYLNQVISYVDILYSWYDLMIRVSLVSGVLENP